MNRTIHTTVTLCILALVVGCGDGPFTVPTAPTDVPTAPAIADMGMSVAAPAGQDEVIERMARNLAGALADPAFRASLYAEARSQYTGDTEALYVRLASKRVGQTSWENRLNVSATPEELARLHFYVHGIEYPNSAYVPLVAVGVSNEDAVVLKAFDSQGNEHELDARVEPALPVVVVALNERIDASGQPQSFLDIDGYADTQAGAELGLRGGDGGAMRTSASSSRTSRTSPHAETIGSIYLINDHEPWWKGSPEIKMQMNLVAQPGIDAWRGSFPDVDDEGVWYHVDHFLFYWYRDPPNNDMGSAGAVKWWEEDFSIFETTVSVSYRIADGSTVTFSFKLGSQDDDMGSALVNFADRLGTTYNTGDIKWRHR